MDTQLRTIVFNWLTSQINIYGDVLDRKLLAEGFIYNNERITLLGPQGIWKPKSFQLPLSITTTTDSPYSDSIDSNTGLLTYNYRTEGIEHYTTKNLIEVMQKKIPLIYFHGIIPGKYLATFPVYIINNNPKSSSFTVAVDDIHEIVQVDKFDAVVEPNETYLRRKYITTEVKVRLHQRIFRERVIEAYKTQCAFCRLRHNELLDAAHIIPDGEEFGEPEISNGLSLCKIHHAAYDKLIIGITPDYIIQVKKEILEEIDGPMLKYGIQSLNGSKLILPTKEKNYPDREKLAVRFDRFLKRA